MNFKTKNLSLLAALCVVLFCADVGISLIMTGGDETIELPYHGRGWPRGSIEMANLSTRISWWAGPPFGTGSMYEFEYHAENTDQFNRALETFATIDANSLELIVRNGPKQIFFKDKEKSNPENRIDWTFRVWDEEAWNRLYNNPDSLFGSDSPNFRKPVAPPRVDVYIGGGRVVWEEVKVPENLIVIDKRPGSISKEFAGKGLLDGTVIDMVTKDPIAGAEIVLAKRDKERNLKEVIVGKTNDEGFCQITHIPLDYYEVGIRAEGYASRKQGSYNNKRPEYYRFEAGLAYPSYIKGVVTDLAGNPIESAKVRATNIVGVDGFRYPCIGGRTATTDKQGRFVINDLPRGIANVYCRLEPLHMTNFINEIYPIPSDSIKLLMEGTAVIRGKVVDKDGKRPSGEVHLILQPPGDVQIGKWGYSGRLSEDGTFEIAGVPPGEYLIGTDFRIMTETENADAQLISVTAGEEYELEVLHK